MSIIKAKKTKDEFCQTCSYSRNGICTITWCALAEIQDSGERKAVYWHNICDIQADQTAKGVKKYGVTLEQNTAMTTGERLRYLEEELIDGLMYIEHIKADTAITGNEYQEKALRTANCDDWEKLLDNGIYGLIGEVGEAADIVKKWKFQGHELDKEHLAEELGDIAWYLAITAHAINKPLNDIFRENISKLEKRYPEGFSADRSVNREEKK